MLDSKIALKCGNCEIRNRLVSFLQFAKKCHATICFEKQFTLASIDSLAPAVSLSLDVRYDAPHGLAFEH